LYLGIYHTSTFFFNFYSPFTGFKLLSLSLNLRLRASDKEIDKMVYELYGLTEEEIEIVEGG
jgi:hypothetical protein